MSNSIPGQQNRMTTGLGIATMPMTILDIINQMQPFAASIMIFYRSIILLEDIGRETPRKGVALLSLTQMHSQSIVIHLSTNPGKQNQSSYDKNKIFFSILKGKGLECMQMILRYRIFRLNIYITKG